jgi:hypothetical protein
VTYAPDWMSSSGLFLPSVITRPFCPLFDADWLSDPVSIHTLGSAGPPAFDHDTRGGEPLDCGIVKAVLA